MLLDTHVLLWWLFDHPNLSPGVANLIARGGDHIVVSAVSGFEIATKQALGKLEAPDDLTEQVEQSGFAQLPLSLAHGVAAGKLPLHHRDPFDRLLIAQAQLEGLTLVTADHAMAMYDVPTLAAR
jgi:PIN domain nuclease of toxin-antitoxin system